jgi:hypothetical protein
LCNGEVREHDPRLVLCDCKQFVPKEADHEASCHDKADGGP